MKRKIANKLLDIKNGGITDGAHTTLDNIVYFEGSTQADIPIKDIRNGVIQTKDDRFIGIVEILPLNFYKKTPYEQRRIMNEYAKMFKRNDYKFAVHIWSDKTNPYGILKQLEKNCTGRENKKVEKALSEYIMFLYSLGNTDSVTKRFFFVFEHREEDGRKGDSIESVTQSINEAKADIRTIMQGCGNVCIVPEDETYFATEVLYTFFNRNTSKKESLDERYERITSDFKKFNEMTGMKKEVTYADLIAPKGLYYDNRNYIYMDGYYYGFIGIIGDKWPDVVGNAWLDRFNYGAFVDVVLNNVKLPHEVSKVAINGANKFALSSLKTSLNKGKSEKAEKWNSTYMNNKRVYDEMNNGTSLYNSGLFLVVRAYTSKDLAKYKRLIQKDLKGIDIETDDAYLSCEDYFRMAMPLLYITPSFNVLKHNFLASQIATTYCFTSYELYDVTGFVLGLNKDNDSILAINNFNTNYYKNANMVILGTSGAGKSFTEEMMGRRMFLNGKRCFYIIPKKGYTYRGGVEDLDGAYVQLYPGSPHCINVMEIRPEGVLDTSVLTEDVTVTKGSWLAKKITNLLMWMQLLLGNRQMTTREYNKLNVLLKDIYADYGITEDNRSIFADDTYTTLKTMPIIQDIYVRASDEPELNEIADHLFTFVYGNCANMNQSTNVDLNKRNIVFDVDEDLIGEKLLPSFLYIAFCHAYNEVKGNTQSDDIIFLDEVWKMFVNEECAKQVQNMVKLVRGYKGATVMATQEISDFINAPGGFGKSVLNNSEISLILNMKSEDLELVKNNLKLTEADCEKIISYKRGTGMLISNGDKIEVDIRASQEEIESFDETRQFD